MNLEIFNHLFDGIKENSVVQNFVKELSNYLENTSNSLSSQENRISTNCLKQEEGLYQVVDMGTDGVYLQNVRNNQVSKETDIAKEVLEKIGNDSVLRYQNGEYILEEELTKDFLNHLIGIKEYKEIQDNFIKESNILEIAPNTRYKIETREKDYCVLSYGNDEKNTIKVPNALIPFWTNTEENLYYENGKFNRETK